MKLEDFLFNPDFYAFTRLLTKEIIQFEQTAHGNFSPKKKIKNDQWLPHDDFFNWDPCPNDIFYGRYYQYQPSAANTAITAATEIWIGLEILKKGVSFIVWIEKSTTPNYEALFKNKQREQKINISELLDVNTPPDYFIIRLDNAKFENYCSSVKGVPSNQSGLNIIQDFFAEVFF